MKKEVLGLGLIAVLGMYGCAYHQENRQGIINKPGMINVRRGAGHYYYLSEQQGKCNIRLIAQISELEDKWMYYNHIWRDSRKVLKRSE